MKQKLIISWQLAIIILAVGTGVFKWQSGAALVPAIACSLSILMAGLPLPLLASSPLVLYRTGRKSEELGVTIRCPRKSMAALAEAHTLVIGSKSLLTTSEPFISQLIPEGISQPALLAMAASAEKESDHPLGRLIYNTASERRLRIQPAIGYNEAPGQGVEAVVNRIPIRVGGAAWLKGEGVDISAELLTKADQLSQKGKLPLFVSSGKYARGIIVIEDEISMDTIAALHRLQRMGLSLLLLTGSTKRMANAVRKQTGIDEVRYELTPSGKEREITLLRTRETTIAMLGDPIHDKAALASADVSLAWQHTTAVETPAKETETAKNALETDEAEVDELSSATLPPPAPDPHKVHITIPRGDLMILARLRSRAESAMKIVHQNHIIAIIAYLLLLPLASGLLSGSGLPVLDPLQAFIGNVSISALITLLSLRA